MLMDEYETPVSRLFMKKINKDEMEEIIGFHNDLMISTFKDNPSVSHALMAGILMTGPTGTVSIYYLNNYAETKVAIYKIRKYDKKCRRKYVIF